MIWKRSSNYKKTPFASVVVFSAALATGSVEESTLADSVVLITTLHLQDMSKKMCNNRLQIISEIYDPNTKDLVSQAGSDWVVSNELVSMAMTQMAECKENRQIWEELFVPEGNELYFVSVTQYLLEPDEEICFWDLFARGRSRNEIVIGWVEEGNKPEINPVDKTTRRVFNPELFRICVLAVDMHSTA